MPAVQTHVDLALLDVAKRLKEAGSKVPDPHKAITERRTYPPQFKIAGNIYYYQLPEKFGSRIVLWWKDGEALGTYDWDGLELPDV